jgi:hypothetical protein
MPNISKSSCSHSAMMIHDLDGVRFYIYGKVDVACN